MTVLLLLLLLCRLGVFKMGEAAEAAGLPTFTIGDYEPAVAEVLNRAAALRSCVVCLALRCAYAGRLSTRACEALPLSPAASLRLRVLPFDCDLRPLQRSWWCRVAAPL